MGIVKKLKVLSPSNINYNDLFKKLINDLIKEPFYILFHPIKGFYEFKAENLKKNYVAVFYLLLMIATRILEFNGKGFLVNPNNPNDFNALRIMLLVLVPVFLITVGNWSITSLFDGKGKLNEIFTVICYSFFPYVVIMLPNILYSNFLIISEVGFFNAFSMIAVFGMCFMLFFGLLGIHEYGLLKTIVTIIFTVIAIGVIIFISFLFLTLFQNVYSFVYSFYDEFRSRFL